MTQAETTEQTAITAPQLSGNADTTTAPSKLKPRGKPFVSGDPRSNLAGRPRKGHTVLDETRKLAERKAKKVAEAAVARLMRDDAVGNRAWSDYRDTFHGVPKQTLVVQQGMSEADALDAELAALLRGDTYIIEGESRVLDADGAVNDITAGG